MNKKEAGERIKKLRETINYHRYLYHVLDKEEISDEALDSLKHELKKLEDQYPDLITPDSPTQRVGGEPLKEFKKVRHTSRMISLEDVFSEDEFKDWMEKTQKLVPDTKLKFYSELKIDGFAISLIYKKGVFVLGSTRGNGEIGEDVTVNLKTIESIPLRLRMPAKEEIKSISLDYERIRKIVEDGDFEIRGEVYMNKKDFLRVNKERERENLPLYANPRNTAAGSIRQLDPKIAASRKLNFLAYDVITNFGQIYHHQEHKLASFLGFRTDPDANICENIEDVVDFYKKIMKGREKLPYQIDGVVVNEDENSVFERLGIVGKAPRGAIAFKFPPMQSTAIIKEIRVQVGRTGVLTPVAVFNPVIIGGAKVSRSTLHNMDEIKRLDIRVGDTVIVERSGDVIPKVVEVIKSLRPKGALEFHIPKFCPVDGSPVIHSKGEVYYYCSNKNCWAQLEGRTEHFVSRTGMDIDGLGPSIIKTLIDNNLIEDAADLYEIKKEDLEGLERFAEKSATNIVDSIQKSRHSVELWKFVYALGIERVGEETAVAIANYFGSIDKIISASYDDLQGIPGIGQVSADSIVKWFADKHNKAFVKKLLKYIEIKKQMVIRKLLSGKNFVVTGSLNKFTREEIKEKIRNLGGNVSESVSSSTTYLIAGEDPGSKIEKAQKLNIPIISEEEFLKMIK